MGYITGLTRGKKEYVPRFVKAVDGELCIGCGRCMKICARGVLAPKEVDEEDSAKLVARHIHPMKTGVELPIEAAVEKLQTVLRGKPPPWLRKAMGLPPEPASPTEDEDP